MPSCRQTPGYAGSQFAGATVGAGGLVVRGGGGGVVRRGGGATVVRTGGATVVRGGVVGAGTTRCTTGALVGKGFGFGFGLAVGGLGVADGVGDGVGLGVVATGCADDRAATGRAECPVPAVEPQPINVTPPMTAATESLTTPANNGAPELLFIK